MARSKRWDYMERVHSIPTPATDERACPECPGHCYGHYIGGKIVGAETVHRLQCSCGHKFELRKPHEQPNNPG